MFHSFRKKWKFFWRIPYFQVAVVSVVSAVTLFSRELNLLYGAWFLLCLAACAWLADVREEDVLDEKEKE